MTQIVLLRHGETEDLDVDVDGRKGIAHAPLSDEGREWVEAMSRQLVSTYDFDRMYAAITRPARETAALARLAGVGPHPVFEAAWDSRVSSEYYDWNPEDVGDDTASGCVESIMDTDNKKMSHRERIVARWNRLCNTVGEDEDVLVVTHSFPMSVILEETNDIGTGSTGTHISGECLLTTLRLDTGRDGVGDDRLDKAKP